MSVIQTSSTALARRGAGSLSALTSRKLGHGMQQTSIRLGPAVPRILRKFRAPHPPRGGRPRDALRVDTELTEVRHACRSAAQSPDADPEATHLALRYTIDRHDS
jgi:hypothetical protein